MRCIAFAVPMLPGKTDADRIATRSCSEGERKAEHGSSRQRHGISREAVWIQSTPGGDMPVVYLDADDLQAAFAGIGSPQEPFDRWFRDMVREIHGIDLEQGFPPPEQLMDYRRGKCPCDARRRSVPVAAAGSLGPARVGGGAVFAKDVPR
jgi:hypothetical protein